MAGTLYLVATPIGNLEDITLRALRILGEVDIVACEDTRHTRKLLAHYSISRGLVSYHEHNERERATELLGMLEQGKSVALVTDAGMPSISDPGHVVVNEAIRCGIRVSPVPGPSALISAVAASGLAGGAFLFVGFLPPRRGGRKRRLAELMQITAPLVLYEAPHRLRETLDDAREVLGDRPAAVARELTKIHEEIRRGKLSELSEYFGRGSIRGECVVVIAGEIAGHAAPLRVEAPLCSIVDEVRAIMSEKGLDQKAALKQAARNRGITRREAYRLYVQEGNERPGDIAASEPSDDPGTRIS